MPDGLVLRARASPAPGPPSEPADALPSSELILSEIIRDESKNPAQLGQGSLVLACLRTSLLALWTHLKADVVPRYVQVGTLEPGNGFICI